MGKLLATAAEEETPLRVLVHAAANVGMVIIIIIIIMKTYKAPLTEGTAAPYDTMLVSYSKNNNITC